MIETTVTAQNGTPFTVVLEVRKPAYLTTPTIAFYDRRYTEKFGPRGQFISEYHPEIIREVVESNAGLNLMGGVPSWQIDAASLLEAWVNVTMPPR